MYMHKLIVLNSNSYKLMIICFSLQWLNTIFVTHWHLGRRICNNDMSHYWFICWIVSFVVPTLIARFMGPTWGPSGADRAQVSPILAHELCYLGSHYPNQWWRFLNWAPRNDMLLIETWGGVYATMVWATIGSYVGLHLLQYLPS